MADRWAKLWTSISTDESMGDIVSENPWAGLIFTWALPHADVYGILPGASRVLRALIMPMVDISLREFDAAVDLLCADGGPWQRYAVDGTAYIYVRGYSRYQSVNFGRVAPPTCPLPPGWVVPEQLLDTIASPPVNRSREMAGLASVMSELHGMGVDMPSISDERVLDQSRTQAARGERVLDQSRTQPPTDERVQDQSRTRRVDTDTDTDTDTDNGNGRTRAREIASTDGPNDGQGDGAETAPPQGGPVAVDPDLSLANGRAQNNPDIGGVLREHTQVNPNRITEWVSELVLAVGDPAYPISSNEDMMALIRASPPARSDVPSFWLRGQRARMERERSGGARRLMLPSRNPSEYQEGEITWKD